MLMIYNFLRKWIGKTGRDKNTLKKAALCWLSLKNQLWSKINFPYVGDQEGGGVKNSKNANILIEYFLFWLNSPLETIKPVQLFL